MRSTHRQDSFMLSTSRRESPTQKKSEETNKKRINDHKTD